MPHSVRAHVALTKLQVALISLCSSDRCAVKGQPFGSVMPRKSRSQCVSQALSTFDVPGWLAAFNAPFYSLLFLVNYYSHSC